MSKTQKQLERIVRGFSNHRRIQMIQLLDAEPELDLTAIAQRCRTNFKTASEHVRRLAIAGLVLKRSAGRQVRHALSPRGKSILGFLKALE